MRKTQMLVFLGALIFGAALEIYIFCNRFPAPRDEASVNSESVTSEDAFVSTTETIDTLQPGDCVDASRIGEDVFVYFTSDPILEGDEVFRRIDGKSYRENDDIALSDLRYLKMLHYNFDHDIQVGEMIVNAAISDDVLSVFRELYEAEYEIESMRLIDTFWMGDGTASDDESIRNNNTSAFCYRTIAGSNTLSNHAFGRAIDINPKQNPYFWKDGNDVWRWSAEDAGLYLDRTGGAQHMIVKDDICCRIFQKYGFSWGGNWENPVDYQHFEVGAGME